MILQPFLYQGLVNEVLGSLGLVLVHGGPWLGKTTFLYHIHYELKHERSDVLLVRASEDNALINIKTWCENPRGILLIDDLDHVYDRETEKLFRNLPQAEWSGSNKFHIIATSGTPSRALDIYGFGLNEKPVQRLI